MRYLPETMGPGVAFVDYDNDGWMDIFLVNSGVCDCYALPEGRAMVYIEIIGTAHSRT